jgi:hypothetical protein
MVKSKAFWTGIIGVLLFVLTTIIGGFLHPNYSHTSQFISELYAVDAPNADSLRYIGYIPSGIFFFLFSIFAIVETPKSIQRAVGFLGIGFGYGLGTVVCGFFTCDAGCNPEFINPSLSQLIHNLMGFVTYCIVPVSILLIAMASRKWKNSTSFSNISFVLAIISFCFVVLLNTNLHSPYKGLIQRVIEGSILIWIALCSFYFIKNKESK